MNWAIAGVVYAAAYAALMTGLAGRADARLVIGNLALLLPPLAPLYVWAARRQAWRGRQAAFWGTIAAWAILGLIGRAAWASARPLHPSPLPGLKRPTLSRPA